MTSRTARRIPRRGGRRGLRERFRTFRRALLGRVGRQTDWNINACFSSLAVHQHLFPASPQPLRASTTTKRDAFVGLQRTRPHPPFLVNPSEQMSHPSEGACASARVGSRCNFTAKAYLSASRGDAFTRWTRVSDSRSPVPATAPSTWPTTLRRSFCPRADPRTQSAQPPNPRPSALKRRASP